MRINLSFASFNHTTIVILFEVTTAVSGESTHHSTIHCNASVILSLIFNSSQSIVATDYTPHETEGNSKMYGPLFTWRKTSYI